MCEATQAGTLPRLARPAPQGSVGLLAMDAATRASLEIHRARDGGTLHTLLGPVQRTLSPAGARMLAGWLRAPLTTLRDRCAPGRLVVATAERDAAEKLRGALRATPDIARALARLSVNRGGPRDLAALRDGLRAGRAAAAALHIVMAGLVQAIPASAGAPTDGRTGPAMMMGRRKRPTAIFIGTACGARVLHVDPALEQRLADALADPAPHRLDNGMPHPCRLRCRTRCRTRAAQ